MAQFEKQHIYPYIKIKSTLYLRYTDDISMIWTGTAHDFFENLNRKHKAMKIEHNISNNNISFLDILIFKGKNSALQTTLYCKPTKQQSYLHANSDHPKSVKNSMPHCQARRIKTICSALTKHKKHFAEIWGEWLGGLRHCN